MWGCSEFEVRGGVWRGREGGRCGDVAFVPCCVGMIASQRGMGTKDESSRNQTRHDLGLY